MRPRSCVYTSGNALIGEVLLLDTLIAQTRSGAGLVLSHKQEKMALATYLHGCGEVGPWLADGSECPGSRVTMDERSNPYVRWIREYSEDMYPSAVEMGSGALPVHALAYVSPNAG